jgi:O-methyltransferase
MIRAKITRLYYEMVTSPTAKSIMRENLTYLTPQRICSIQRELTRIKKTAVPGTFVEFGVALGGSAILAAKSLDHDRAFHGFDVFGMIPAPTSEKDDAHSKARYDVIKSGSSRGLGGEIYYGYREDLYAEVSERFAKYGVPVDGTSIVLHKGLFEETWPSASCVIGKIAFAHVDCDWYEPVRFCLAAIGEKLVSGGAIIVDDYNDYGGCRTATDEFLKQRPDLYKKKQRGNLVIRKR